MAVTIKAKSAIHHLEVAKSGLEKAKLHLLQAKVALRKDDTESRIYVDGVMKLLDTWEEAVSEAAEIIGENNPSQEKE